MYLKEAFRYQNFLNTMVNTVIGHLGNAQYITKTVQEHLRSKVNPEAEDEVIDLSSKRTLPYTANQMADFLQHLLDEKQQLTAAISAAKKTCNIDIDSEIANNRTRYQVAALFARMGNMRPSERQSQAYGHKFNAEGNQTAYAYTVKEVTTIDFDRNKIKAMGKRFIQQADDASAAIDRIMVDLMIEYQPRYSVNDSFEDVIEQFLTTPALTK